MSCLEQVAEQRTRLKQSDNMAVFLLFIIANKLCIINHPNVKAHGPPVWPLVEADQDHQHHFTGANLRRRRSHAAGVRANSYDSLVLFLPLDTHQIT